MSDSRKVTAVSTRDLMMPSVSGSEVKMSLGEVDALRASAANAIKVAQELEAQQSLVRIEVVERYQSQELGYSTSSIRPQNRPIPSWERENSPFALEMRRGEEQRRRAFEESSWVERTRVLNISMVNMEEIMGELGKEANFRLEATHRAEVTTLEDLNKKCQEKLEKANSKHFKAEERIVDLVDQLNQAQRERDGFSDTVDSLMTQIEGCDKLQANLEALTNKYADVTSKYHDLLRKDTFWGWVTDKFKL